MNSAQPRVVDCGVAIGVSDYLAESECEWCWAKRLASAEIESRIQFEARWMTAEAKPLKGIIALRTLSFFWGKL